MAFKHLFNNVLHWHHFNVIWKKQIFNQPQQYQFILLYWLLRQMVHIQTTRPSIQQQMIAMLMHHQMVLLSVVNHQLLVTIKLLTQLPKITYSNFNIFFLFRKYCSTLLQKKKKVVLYIKRKKKKNIVIIVIIHKL